MAMPKNSTISYAGLAEILCRSVSTVRSDRVRRPESLPPACRIPGSSRPVWIYEDVIAWLRAHRTEYEDPALSEKSADNIERSVKAE